MSSSFGSFTNEMGIYLPTKHEAWGFHQVSPEKQLEILPEKQGFTAMNMLGFSAAKTITQLWIAKAHEDLRSSPLSTLLTITTGMQMGHFWDFSSWTWVDY